MIWDWDIFRQELFDGGFLAAAWTTIWLAFAAQAIALTIGAVLALGLLSTARPLVLLAGIYVWIWRGTPILVQLLVLYFGLPQIGIRLTVIMAGLIGLSLNEAAFLAILIKANLLAVPIGQADAGRVLGMTRSQRIRLIILPQGVRTFLPTLGNQVNSMIKTTSLVSVISVQELLAYTRSVVSDTYRPFEPFAVATIYYLVISSLWNLIQIPLERKLDVGKTASQPVSHRRTAAALASSITTASTERGNR